MAPLAGRDAASASSRISGDNGCALFEVSCDCDRFRTGNAEMIHTRKLPGVVLLMPLLYMTGTALAEDAPFTYSDDWRLVSAPPPPGPYNAVNIDPRVPRQEAIPPVTTGTEAQQQSWQPLPDEMLANPPAAGRPESSPDSLAPQQRDYQWGGAPGSYQGYTPGPPPDAVVVPRPGQYPSYGDMPPSGYYRSPAINHEQQVPPPPAYDAMTGESGDAYHSP